MGHLIQWDNREKTVVLQQYTGEAIKDDLYYLAQKSADLLNRVSQTVYLIIDERSVKHNLSSADVRFLEKHVPANQGMAVVIVDNKDLAYKKIVQEMNKKIAPKAFEQPIFVESLEEARQVLQEQYGVHYP